MALAARLNAEANDINGVCYGCVQPFNAAQYGGIVAANPERFGAFCKELAECMTPCEVDLMARMQLQEDGKVLYASVVDERITYLLKQETWVCRYARLGVVGKAEDPGQMWVAAMYVSLIQLGGGVGSIVPENVVEVGARARPGPRVPVPPGTSLALHAHAHAHVPCLNPS